MMRAMQTYLGTGRRQASVTSHNLSVLAYTPRSSVWLRGLGFGFRPDSLEKHVPVRFGWFPGIDPTSGDQVHTVVAQATLGGSRGGGI